MVLRIEIVNIDRPSSRAWSRHPRKNKESETLNEPMRDTAGKK